MPPSSRCCSAISSRLQSGLAARGYTRDFLVMQGNGGTVSARNASKTAVQTVMSGPASGVIAAAFTATAAGIPNVITYDMGGTSTDVALIARRPAARSRPSSSSSTRCRSACRWSTCTPSAPAAARSPRSTPPACCASGPRAPARSPGPICYGRGGSEPTITDANLVLGRLDPERLLAVEQAVSMERVRQALLEQSAPARPRRRGAAAAIVRVANDKMAGAIRMVSLSRGHDPRDFALFAFGGAGPLHAAALARELGIRRC